MSIMVQASESARGVAGRVSLALLTLACVGLQNVAADEKSAPTATRGGISGRIVDGANAPVLGAKATLFLWQSPTKRWGRWQATKKSVNSDHDGLYRFEELQDGYFLVSVEGPGFAKVYRDSRIEDDQAQRVNFVLNVAATATIRVEDQHGQSISGARVRGFTLRGVNGECGLSHLALDSLGIIFQPSDQNGELLLRDLPQDDVIDELVIDRPGFAPAELEGLKVARGTLAKVTMRPGIVVTLRVPPGSQSPALTEAVMDLRHEPFGHPSTFINYEARFDPQGVAQFSVEQGNYSWLLLQHEHFFFTPVYSGDDVKKRFLRFEPGRNQDLQFDVRRKVLARGRVVNAVTGQPVEKMSIMGELANGPLTGWNDAPSEKWSFAGWGESDQRGEYKIDLAAGPVRVSFKGREYLSEHDYYEFALAADGSTVIPEIRVRPIPKIAGVVRNPDGSAAVRTVVRMGGKYKHASQPVLTDNEGRFEIQPSYAPYDEETKKRINIQPLIAFDPFSPLAARADRTLDQAEQVVLKLEPHEPGWPLSAANVDLTEFEHGVVSPEVATKNAAISLRGKPAPELDAALWLNTGNQPLNLASLRGQYVLLDFWFTECGPCHADFPSVKLVHELYKDKDVLVIGIHNNSSEPEAVRTHVAKIGLPFPVAVDHADGRTVARFEQHGLPAGYPDYVLISPEGKVLFDDRTIPAPTLRNFKLEIIRKLLLDKAAGKKQ